MRKITLTLEESLLDDLAKTAMETGLKKTQIVREALRSYLQRNHKEKRRKEWLEENKEAFEEYNRVIEGRGIYGRRFRKF